MKDLTIKEFFAKNISNFYSVQVGAFSSRRNAAYLEVELVNSGFNTFIGDKEITGGVLYKVFVGEFKEYTQAQKKAEILSQAGYPVLIVNQREVNDKFIEGIDSENYGRIDITCEPEGAKIFINGIYQEQAPAIIEKVLSGIYEIKLELLGYQIWTKELDLKPLDRIIVNINLNKISKE